MLSKFPVLRVPQMVLTEIINQIELGDLIALSLCSRNMFVLAQSHRTNMNEMELGMSCLANEDYKISCYGKVGGRMTGTPILTVSNVEDLNSETTVTVKIINQCIPVFVGRDGERLRTFCLDRVSGIQEMTRYVSKLLKKEGIKVAYLDESSLWLPDWVKTVQPRLPVAKVQSNESFNQEQYEQVLEKCEAIGVILHAKPPQSFEFKNEFLERKFIFIRYGFWISLEHLLNMRIPYVDIQDSKLTSADLNAFLKHWLRGGSLQLEYLSVNFDGNPDIVFHGLREKMVLIEKARRVILKAIHGKVITFGGGIEFRQANGRRATIARAPKQFVMAVGDDFIET